MSRDGAEVGSSDGGRSVIPPVSTFEGLAKVVLGVAAGSLLLYAVWKSIETRRPVQEETLYILGGLIVAFLGVDLWAILQRAKDGGKGGD